MGDNPATPMPFVDSLTLSKSHNPLKPPSRGLQRQALKSVNGPPGVIFTLRKQGRLAGQGHVHSVLVALAIRARESGDTTGALALRQDAERLEDAYRRDLAAFLESASLDSLHQASFFERLVDDTRTAISEWGGLARLVFATGHLTRRTGGDIEVAGFSPTGDPVSLSLPESMWPQPRQSPASVLVFLRVVGSAAVIDLLPAITETPAGLVDEFDEESSAMRYLAGPGCEPSPEERLNARLALDKKPSRRITLIA